VMARHVDPEIAESTTLSQGIVGGFSHQTFQVYPEGPYEDPTKRW